MADILVIMPHPDDAEITCGGTIAAMTRQGASVVIVDGTRGELGSRGTPETRAAEAARAAAILGVAIRENLGLPDGGIPADDVAARRLIVDCIRRHAPRVVIAMNEGARHPDHINMSQLVRGAIKAAALHQFAVPSEAPAVADVRLFQVEAELPVLPRFIVPCTDEDWERKRQAILAYHSQLYRPDAEDEPATSIATPEFLTAIDARGRAWGHQAHAPYGEAFVAPEALRVSDLRLI